MNKKIYIDEQHKSVVVVLYNNQYKITAKGRAICHETDTFDKEIGIKLANNRAWKSYYNKLFKYMKDYTDWADSMIAYHTRNKEEYNKIIDHSRVKLAEIEKEQEELLANL